MDELKKGLLISLHGKRSNEIIKKVHKIVRQWGLRLPDVDPLVLDFGLGRFNEIGEVEFWIANEKEAGYCGKFLFLFEGQRCPNHMHKVKLETFFVVKGQIEMIYNGKTIVLKAGDTLRMETGVYHGFLALEPVLLLEVSRPSLIDDNYFENTLIPIGGNYKD
jgi:N-acetylneuraminate synthase